MAVRQSVDTVLADPVPSRAARLRSRELRKRWAAERISVVSRRDPEIIALPDRQAGDRVTGRRGQFLLLLAVEFHFTFGLIRMAILARLRAVPFSTPMVISCNDHDHDA